MKIRYERPVCYTAFWSYRLGLFALALFAISAGLHRFAIMESDIFAVLFAISTGLALLAFIFACYGILRLWMVGAEGGRASAKGCICALIVLVPAGLVGYRAYTLPPLYDIATDTASVPEFIEPVTHGPDWMPHVKLFESAPYAGQAEAYPQVTGRRYEGALDRVLEAVRLVAENRGIKISSTRMPQPPEDVAEPDAQEPAQPGDAAAIVSEADDTDSIISLREILAEESAPQDPVVLKQAQIVLQGEARTLVFGFGSDVSIRLSEEAETTFVDMRAVSRFGPHDLGANAWIISEFLRELDMELVGISVR
ncbi:DUF1499 domain-containing protein [Hoeflea prorocentri]|uniref:DUF1499 domain-containing protein n=1 Tax=Hoeflea prorocentri TaxID=1922333 RepID=A0A9X3ZI47_9HYPH|nr:DUF1499 domain-containing protein [Hoeflea prorocentri]MCY6381628.1 DUF1499 domain-containing protein [Hoeflea prorocentri]MDA5399428.1 DUF1499 domain-containing protein [Hoeflea prorocentri]